MNFKNIIFIGGFLFVAGCATEITDSGRNVMMVSALSATEAERYTEIGPISCDELTAIPNIEESCRNQMRNSAAANGADILAIESQEWVECFPASNHDHKCLHMSGRAFRKKSLPTPTPSPTPSPSPAIPPFNSN